MIDLFKSLLGYHVCDDWSRWEEKTVRRKAITTCDGIPIPGTEREVIDKFQQRYCLECGKIQQQELEY